MSKRTIAFLLIFLSLGLSRVLHQACAAEVSWTMVVVPDTQNYRGNNNQLPKLHTMMQWIVDNKESRNIQLVASQGDFRGNWEEQADAWGKLNGEVPYIVVAGNHDYDPGGEREDLLLNDFFALSDNPLNSITTERIAGRLENTYSAFEALDGRKMLVFSLEWEPREEVFDWANTIAGQAQFADYTAVVLVHEYLRELDLFPDGTDRPIRTVGGESIWNGVVKKNKNFELVLNGHHFDANDSDPYDPLATGRQTSVGVEGNIVHEILFNAQQQPNGGNGYIRLMEFMDDGTTVQVRTYSPTLDVWLTNDRNEFQIELTPLFSGDFDEDDDVDGADFLAWQRGYGISSGAQFSQGDANRNGAVDGIDLDKWQRQYGTNASLPAAESVPEPSSIALLTLAFVAASLLRIPLLVKTT